MGVAFFGVAFGVALGVAVFLATPFLGPGFLPPLAGFAVAVLAGPLVTRPDLVFPMTLASSTIAGA